MERNDNRRIGAADNIERGRDDMRRHSSRCQEKFRKFSISEQPPQITTYSSRVWKS
jgi:hypothetical protein